MRILDIINGMWAMAGPRVEEIQSLYYAHTRREKLDLKAWEAATGRPAGSERQPYEMKGSVAVIPIQGVMTKMDSAWNRICGMTSTVMVQQDLQAALQDPQVKSILLWIDSPGGMVDGTQELADAVFAARSQKPIVALGDGCMCSAAMWVGAAAEKVYITCDTTEVGSIGVVTSHTDISAQEAQQGRTTTVLTSGKYKRIAHQHAPLTQEGADYITSQLDHIYTVFVDSIAKFRGVSADTVLADMADGRVFMGQQAVAAGLVDGVSTMTDLIAQLNQDPTTQKPGAGAASIPLQPTSLEDSMPITREQLAAEAPELLTAILAEGEAKGTAAETTRVKGCLDSAVPGYEAIALTHALDGKTSPDAAARAVNTAIKADLAKAGKTATDPNAGAPVISAVDDPTHAEAEAQRAKAEATAKASKDPKAVWDADANLRAEFGEDYAAYEAYNKAEKSGQARILGQSTK